MIIPIHKKIWYWLWKLNFGLGNTFTFKVMHLPLPTYPTYLEFCDLLHILSLRGAIHKLRQVFIYLKTANSYSKQLQISKFH